MITTSNISNYLETVLKKHKFIQKELEQKKNVNEIILEAINEYTLIEKFLINHLKNNYYKEWGNKVLYNVNNFKNSLNKYYIYEKKYIGEYNDKIKNIIKKIDKNIEQITNKIGNYIEWYQIPDIINKYKLIQDNIILPLSFPNLYINNNKKILFYGEPGIGKFTYIQAILNNILKLEPQYDILIINHTCTFNDVQIENINNILSLDIKKLIILVRNIEKHKDIVENFYYKLELKNPIWLITSGLKESNIMNFDFTFSCESLTQEKIKWYLKLFISDYLLNSNPYYLIYNDFQNKIFSIKDTNVLVELSVLYFERYKYILNYNVPIKEQDDVLEKISELIYTRKYNLHDIQKIVKNSIYTLSQFSIKNNIYYSEGINFISALSYMGVKENPYYIDTPGYDVIMVNTNKNKLIKYTNICLYNSNFFIEDDIIQDIYISDNLDIIYKIKLKNIDIYFKTELKNKNIDYKKFYYSYYCSKEYLESIDIEKYKKFINIFTYKVNNGVSLLFEILNHTKSIGISANNNNIHFYNINHNSLHENYYKNIDKDIDINHLLEKREYNLEDIHILLSLKLSYQYNKDKNTYLTNSYLAGLFYYNYTIINNEQLFQLINIDIYNILSNFNPSINRNKLLDDTIIETGSLVKKISNKKYNILNEKQRKNIYSYHIRTEYIRDELL